MLRRVVGSRVKDPHTVDDLVQETLVRVMAARSRIEPDKLPHYASVTARNLVASMAEKNDRARSRSHLLVDGTGRASRPAADVLRQEERAFVAPRSPSSRRRPGPPAGPRGGRPGHHDDGGRPGLDAGAVAARLSRARASLRVEYLLLPKGVEPPTDRCRPVLRALSSGDRRRQRELDASGHLLDCATCARIRPSCSNAARRRRGRRGAGAGVQGRRRRDGPAAGPRGRGPGRVLGADQTLIATAISEITRNIVKFAERGEVAISHGLGGRTPRRQRGGPRRGAGHPDLEHAMRDGFSTYQGLGLGLPGAKRLMDGFDLVSVPGEGTTVTMEKWLP